MFQRAVALYNYDAKSNEEVSFRKGDELVIIESEKDGWLKVANVTPHACLSTADSVAL